MTAMTEAELTALAKLTCQAAREGGALAAEAFKTPPESIQNKGVVDLVTETDLAVEALLRERLIRETGFALLGEEGGRSGPAQGPIWIVDPIDGTTNFAHRLPHFAVSIGLWASDADGTPTAPLLGAVYSPMVDELFWTDGRAAFLNDARLPTLQPVPLGVAILASGFPYDRQTNDDDNTDLWRGFLKRCQGCRRFGAAALDLAWVAAGRVDGFWEPRLKPWDVAAALAILHVVGGRTVDYEGAPYTLGAPGIVAAHPALLQQMLDTIATVRARS